MSHREDRLLEAFGSVVTAIVAGEERDAVLQRIVESIREIVDCDLAAVTVGHPDGGLVTLVADGPEAEMYRGRRFSGAGTSTARVIATGEPVLVDNVSSSAAVAEQTPGRALGPSMFFPLVVDGPIGSLSATRFVGSQPFTDDEVEVLGSFAVRASLVLQRDADRQRRLALRRVAEQTEVAIELQESAIDAIFSTSLLLSSLAGEARDPVVRERLVYAIDELDNAVKLIRQIAFGLVEGRRTTEDRGS